MGWFLVVKGKLNNDEFLIYIFKGSVGNGTPIIFNKILYCYWYKELRTRFSPILINTSQKNVHFSNQINGIIPRCGVNYPETIDPRDFWYQCSKHGPYCLFGKLRMRYFNDEPYFPNKNNQY